MKIIILQNTAGLGKTGDIKEVSDGYARNFLLPKKIAAAANDMEIEKVAEFKRKQSEEEIKKLEKKKDLGKKLQGMEIIITVKQKDGKLFGSINKKMIAEELRKNNFTVDENSVMLEEPIKTTGEKKISLNLGYGIKAAFLLKILPE